MRKHIEINTEIWNYLERNVWVSLYESKPKIVKEKDPSPGALEGSEIRKVILIEGKPLFETFLLGKLCVWTDEWVFNPNLKNEQKLSY